jgi:flagellar biosynthetic protein FlhB
MAEERYDERTEPATPRRREEARERGHVARSADLSSAVILLAAVLALQFFGKRLVDSLFGATTSVLEHLAQADGTRENLVLQFGGAFTAALLGFLPFVLFIVVAAIGINLAQVGFLFVTEPLAPNLDRLDPIAGLGRMFSSRSVARLSAGLLKLAAVGLVVFMTLWSERSRLVGLMGHAFEDIVSYGTGIMLTLALRAVLALLVLALLEYGYQKWQYERDLRMSKQEVREELKRFEGDPKIRERRRAIQRQLAMQRMMQKVPKATVVITNPTHLAVAVEYRKEDMEAPVVIAKGAEHLARRIREIALDHGVPVVERRELAQALYRGVEVGQSIPVELYQAVAEILAYVYRLKGLAAVA